MDNPPGTRSAHLSRRLFSPINRAEIDYLIFSASAVALPKPYHPGPGVAGGRVPKILSKTMVKRLPPSPRRCYSTLVHATVRFQSIRR